MSPDKNDILQGSSNITPGLEGSLRQTIKGEILGFRDVSLERYRSYTKELASHSIISPLYTSYMKPPGKTPADRCTLRVSD